jgi:hypothetical protein
MFYGLEPNTIQDVWFPCPKCKWLNGMDVGLGWAKYVVDELTRRNLSLERIERLLEDVKAHQGSLEELIERNRDVGPILGWLSRINLATLIAFLALVYTVYSSERGQRIAQDQLDATRQEATQQQQLSAEDIERLARELHRLQQEVQIKPPKSSGRAKRRKRGR